MAPAVIYGSQAEDMNGLLGKIDAKAAGPAANGTYDVKEDYDGDYRFAPIEEAQVSRAMIKRCIFCTSSPPTIADVNRA